MPWHVAQSSRCPASKPWAVIKDADSSIEGCHATQDDANKQMAALYASEANSCGCPTSGHTHACVRSFRLKIEGAEP